MTVLGRLMVVVMVGGALACGTPSASDAGTDAGPVDAGADAGATVQLSGAVSASLTGTATGGFSLVFNEGGVSITAQSPELSVQASYGFTGSPAVRSYDGYDGGANLDGYDVEVVRKSDQARWTATVGFHSATAGTCSLTLTAVFDEVWGVDTAQYGVHGVLAATLLPTDGGADSLSFQASF